MLKLQQGASLLAKRKVSVKAGRSVEVRLQVRARISLVRSPAPLRLSGPPGASVSFAR